MTGLAFALVISSALLHALWNFLVKRSGASGSAFTWLFTVPSAILLAPTAMWALAQSGYAIRPSSLLFLAGSAVLHTVSFVILVRGYREGDLSVVYPLARGSGPLVAVALAIALLGERPSTVALLGALCIAGGAAALARDSRPRNAGVTGVNHSVRYGLLIGATIGCYTVWDKYLVASLAMPPLALEWAISTSMAILIAPAALRDRAALRATWSAHKVTAVTGALIASASYILFLTAMKMAPVTRVAPLRESSILLGALLGTHFLAEGRTAVRLVAAAAIMTGVVLLARG